MLLAAATTCGVVVGQGVAHANTRVASSTIKSSAAVSTDQSSGPEVPTVDANTPAALSAATAAAAKSGQPVKVDSLTSQTSTTTANPDGTFTTATSTVPTRVKRGSSWIPVDTTLHTQADGSLAPAAVPSGVSITGGGSSALVTQTAGGTVFTVSWPGTLPKPSVSGDTATYTDALPGVDLKITATVTGVLQTLVVKTKQAASNPALSTLDFPVTVTGGTVQTAADGSLTVLDASGKPVLHGATPTMWDSSGSAAEAKAAPDQAPTGSRQAVMGLKITGTPSSASQVGTASHSTGVAATAPAPSTSGSVATTVQLTPDPHLLSDANAQFPLYLDPDTSLTTLSNYDTVWDVAATYNYLNNGSSLRSGHVWDQTNARYQTNRSFLDFGGSGVFAGKTIRAASMLLYDSYSASCSGTGVQLWGTGSIGTSTTWNNEPGWVDKLDDETFAHGYTAACPGAQVSMNAFDWVRQAAAGNWPDITFGLRADNESDATSWKIFESIRSGYQPQLIVTWTSPAVAPQITSIAFGNTTIPCGGWAGRVSTLDASPLLIHANVYGDGQGNYGGQDYLQVWANVSDNHGDVAPTSAVQVNTTGIGNAVPWTSPEFKESWLQTDSSIITITVSAKNLANQTATSATCSFQLDTISPGTPSLSSTDYPREDWGSTTTQGGKFSITPGPNSGHVTYYHVVADGIGSSYWNQTTSNGAPASFLLNCPGCAFNPFTTPGLHWLTVQAVSIAGNDSNVSNRYYFFVSPNTPQADNATNLTYASVNTTVAAGTQVISQGQPDQYTQVLLWGAPNGSGVWLKDSPSDSGYYAVQGQMTSATDYGKVQVSVTPLDANGNPVTTATQTLPQVFDGYGACCSLSTFDFGGAQLTKGTSYRFTFTAVGTSSPTSPYYNIGVYQLRLVPLHISYTSSTDPNANLAAGFNNIGITDGGTVATGDFDGVGNSFDANSLAAAGYGRGAKITVDGVPFTMPNSAPGTADAMISSGQEIGLGNQTGSAIGLLGSLSFSRTGGSGQINYNGTCNGASTQAFTIAPVPDWGDVTQGSPAWSATAKDRAAVTGVAWNSRDGWAARPNSIYTVMIPIACQNVPLKSVVLPWISPGVGNNVSSLKIFSIGVRPPTQGSSYVSSWAASLDTTVAAGGGTVRMPVRTSLSGTSARIRLDNPYATAPVTIATASIGVQSTGSGTTAAPVALKFGGQASVTIPPGGQVYSDPTTGFTVPSNATLLVSLNIPTAGGYAAHAVSPVSTWTAAGDATGSTGSGYAAAATGWVLLDDLEVTPTGANYQMGSMAVLGDQIGNGDATTTDANKRLGDYIAAALPNAAGVANVSSSGNRLLSDMTPGSGGPSALTRFDRDVCDLPNLNTVVIEEGNNDLHDGKSDVAVDGSGTASGLFGLAQAIKTCGATPLVVPVTPFDAGSAWNAAGEPGYWNGIRSWVNANNLPGALIADGGAASVLSDGADAAKLAAPYDSGDHAMPNDAGMQALAAAITAATPWKNLPAGASDRFKLAGDATDSVNQAYDGSPSPTVNFVTNDRGTLTAARLNGTDSAVTVPDPGGLSTNGPLDTTQSFTISAWVKLTNGTNTGGTQTIVAQNGNQQFGYLLGYENSAKAWIFVMQATDDSTVKHTYVESPALTGSQYDGWNHLVGVYDASAQKISLYVNGTLIGSNPYHATVNFAQQMMIGGGALYQGTATDFLNGDVSDVVLYPSALNASQVQQLYTSTMVNGQ